MTYYRIFTTNPGEFRDSSKYEFVAQFDNENAVKNYVKYMSGKKMYNGKDIIIKEIDIVNAISIEGHVSGVITFYGESLPVEEYEFF